MNQEGGGGVCNTKKDWHPQPPASIPSHGCEGQLRQAEAFKQVGHTSLLLGLATFGVAALHIEGFPSRRKQEEAHFSCPEEGVCGPDGGCSKRLASNPTHLSSIRRPPPSTSPAHTSGSGGNLPACQRSSHGSGHSRPAWASGLNWNSK